MDSVRRTLALQLNKPAWNTFVIYGIMIQIAEYNSTAIPPSDEIEYNEIDVLYQKDAVFDIHMASTNSSADEFGSYNVTLSTTQGPRLEQKLTEVPESIKTTQPLSTERLLCALDCGLGGGCAISDSKGLPACLCPLGKTGDRCDKGK